MTSLAELLLARELAMLDQDPVHASTFRQLAGPTGTLAGITAISFLRYESPDDTIPSARAMLERVIPLLLPQLNRATSPARLELRGRVRGRVDWGATIKARTAAGQDKSIYVCQQSRRLYNLPENQLLKFVLRRLARCHERTPKAALKWCDLSTLEASASGSNVGTELSGVAQRLRTLHKAPHLSDVELPREINGRHLSAGRAARNPLYAQVTAFYEHLHNVVDRPCWDPWSKVIRSTSSILPAAHAQTFALLKA